MYKIRAKFKSTTHKSIDETILNISKTEKMKLLFAFLFLGLAIQTISALSLRQDSLALDGNDHGRTNLNEVVDALKGVANNGNNGNDDNSSPRPVIAPRPLGVFCPSPECVWWLLSKLNEATFSKLFASIDQWQQ